MKYVILLGALILLSSISTASETIGNGQYIKYIRENAKLFAIPELTLLSICYVESKFFPKALHKDDGHGDSIGICQVKQATASWLANLKVSKRSLYDPKINSFYAAAYLRNQINRYHSINKAIVAYNLGHYSPNYTVYLNKVKKASKFLKRKLSDA